MPFESELSRLDSLASIHVTLDLPLCMRALDLYLDANDYSPRELAAELGVSERKLRAVREWLVLMGLLDTGGKQTRPVLEAPLYKQIADSNPQAFLELVYYRLCTRNRLFSGLINVFLADRIRNYGLPTFEKNDALNWFIDFFRTSRSENDLHESFPRFFGPLVRSADGFGTLSLVEERDGAFIVRSHMPDPRVQAYILYDQAQGRPSLRLDEVADGFNSLGRVFFLERPAVMDCLIRMEGQGVIQVDTTAGINQVALPTVTTPRQLLEELANP